MYVEEVLRAVRYIWKE